MGSYELTEQLMLLSLYSPSLRRVSWGSNTHGSAARIRRSPSGPRALGFRSLLWESSVELLEPYGWEREAANLNTMCFQEWT